MQKLFSDLEASIERICAKKCSACPSIGAALSTAQFVRKIIAARSKRCQLFGNELFSDPIWDLLLRFYLCELEGSEDRIFFQQHMPQMEQPTADRFTQILCVKGFVEADHRRSFSKSYRLTPLGAELMRTSIFDSESKVSDSNDYVYKIVA